MTTTLIVIAAFIAGCCVGALAVGIIVAGRLGEDDIE